MPIYVVLMHHVQDHEKLDKYLTRVGDVRSPEFKVLAVDDAPEVVEGSSAPHTVVAEFPTREDFWAFYNSPEYQEILPLRTEAAPGTLVIAKVFIPSPSD